MHFRNVRSLPRTVFAGATLSLFAALASSACSSDDNQADGSGGSSSTGGAKSSGGSSSTGGAKSTGGSSSSSGGSSSICATPGGPADEPKDTHCDSDSGPVVQDVGACVTEADESDAGPDEEETPGPWGGNASADDDCKYDLSYTVTPVCENQDTTFTLTVKSRADKSAVTGANPELEVLDPSGIPAAEGGQTATETSDGVYELEKIRFTKSGKWTVRFHLFETCSDAEEDSPHGHAAFFIDVP